MENLLSEKESKKIIDDWRPSHLNLNDKGLQHHGFPTIF